jgi:hypothetical protein
MSSTHEMLETLIAKLRALPEERQVLAVDALAEIAELDVYVLSADERAVLEPALAEALRGDNLIDADEVEALNKPWV